MKVQMVASKSMRYGTRRLQAGDMFEADSKDARLLAAIKRATPFVRSPAEIPAMPAKLKAQAASKAGSETETDDRAKLREDYFAKFGKRAFHGWDAETLKAKLAEPAPEA